MLLWGWPGRERLIKSVLWSADTAPTPDEPENLLFICFSLLTKHFHWALESFSKHRLGKEEMPPPLHPRLNIESENLLLGLTWFQSPKPSYVAKLARSDILIIAIIATNPRSQSLWTTWHTPPLNRIHPCQGEKSVTVEEFCQRGIERAASAGKNFLLPV